MKLPTADDARPGTSHPAWKGRNKQDALAWTRFSFYQNPIFESEKGKKQKRDGFSEEERRGQSLCSCDPKLKKRALEKSSPTSLLTPASAPKDKSLTCSGGTNTNTPRQIATTRHRRGGKKNAASCHGKAARWWLLCVARQSPKYRRASSVVPFSLWKDGNRDKVGGKGELKREENKSFGTQTNMKSVLRVEG